jgi:hypothetical protein
MQTGMRPGASNARLSDADVITANRSDKVSEAASLFLDNVDRERHHRKRCSAPTFWMAPASTMMPAHEQTSF